MCAISGPEGALRFIAATDSDTACVEENQAEVGEGPCHDAARTGERHWSNDLTAEQRWPRYTGVAARLGFRAAAGLPVVVGEHRIGALNLFRRDAGPWTQDDLETAQLLADVAAGYVVNARTLADATSLNAQLQHALDHRVNIEQAKGVLAERLGVVPDVAFTRLREFARSHQRPVDEVARAVLRSGHLGAEPTSPDDRADRADREPA